MSRKNEEEIVLKLENDIDATDSNKLLEIESFWTNIHGFQTEGSLFKKGEKPKFTFEILSNDKGASFYLSIPAKFKNIIIKKLNAVYPYIEIKEVVKNEPLKFIEEKKEDEYVHACQLVLTEDDRLSLKNKSAEKTFLNNLLNTINHFGEDETTLIQIVMRPVSEKKVVQSENRIGFIKRTSNTDFKLKVILLPINIIITAIELIIDSLITKGELKKSLTKSTNTENKEKENKFKKQCFNVSIKIATKSKDRIISEQFVKSAATVFNDFDGDNKLRPIKVNIRSIKERDVGKNNNLFSVSELSLFCHLPNKNVSADNITHSSIKMPYDKDIPSLGVIFGISPQQNNKTIAFPMIPISLEKYQEIYEEFEKIIDNICKPRLVLGQMGTGKSEWIINYTINLIKTGVSVILVDPKNDTQKRLIESIPEEYLNKIDYIDLGDLIYPPALNILRRRNLGDPTEASLIVQSLISFFKKEFGRSWGFAMQQLIQMTGNAILLGEIASLYEFQLMLTNKEYRERIIEQIDDMLNQPNCTGKAMLKELLQFWRQFHGMSEKDQFARISSTMNKIGVFMSNRIVRAIVSQRDSYDFRKAGDNGRITIVNIPDGELGDENTRLLASYINKAVWLDFRSRANIPIHLRYPTIWLIEEAHIVMDEEFTPVLTQSRGYRLGVTILTQGLTNFDNKGMKELRELILTNCKNKIIFRVGPQDANILSDEFAPLQRFDLMNCPDYHFYSKILLEGGKVSDVFFAKALLPAKVLRSYDEYKQHHRSGKFTIDQIEDQIDERHNLNDNISTYNVLDFDEVDNIPIKEDKPKSSKKMIELQFLE